MSELRAILPSFFLFHLDIFFFFFSLPPCRLVFESRAKSAQSTTFSSFSFFFSPVFFSFPPFFPVRSGFGRRCRNSGRTARIFPSFLSRHFPLSLFSFSSQEARIRLEMERMRRGALEALSPPFRLFFFFLSAPSLLLFSRLRCDGSPMKARICTRSRGPRRFLLLLFFLLPFFSSFFSPSLLSFSGKENSRPSRRPVLTAEELLFFLFSQTFFFLFFSLFPPCDERICFGPPFSPLI